MAVGIWLASDYGVMAPHGTVLRDTSGNPAAVVLGSRASNGREPWDIHGERVWLAVAFAEFRGISLLAGAGAAASVTKLSSTRYLGASANAVADSTGSYVLQATTEANMDRTSPNDVRGSKYYTDAVASGNIAKKCRAVVINEYGPMDLPRISALMRASQWQEFVDSADPTLASYPQRAMMNWGFGSTYDYVHSSSYDTTAGNYVLASTANPHVVQLVYQGAGARNAFGVLPVLEIPFGDI